MTEDRDELQPLIDTVRRMATKMGLDIPEDEVLAMEAEAKKPREIVKDHRSRIPVDQFERAAFAGDIVAVVATNSDESVACSMAISTKRIADALERIAKAMEHVEASEQSAEVWPTRGADEGWIVVPFSGGDDD